MAGKRKADEASQDDAPRPVPRRGSLAGPKRPRRGFVPSPPVKEPRK